MAEYKYYSYLRPVAPGTYPSGITLLSVENYDTRQFCEEIQTVAWGYFVTDTKLSVSDIVQYDLIPAEKRTWHLVETIVDDDGHVSAKYVGTKDAVRPVVTDVELHEDGSTRSVDWFKTKEEAEEFIAEYDQTDDNAFLQEK